MNFQPKHPPRDFEVGFDKKGIISDCGTLLLAPDEQITLITDSNNEYDVTRKDWGFYATPSLNGRLSRFNLRAVLVKNRKDLYFVLLVERGKELEFERYVQEEPLQIVTWLDNTKSLMEIGNRMNDGS